MRLGSLPFPGLFSLYTTVDPDRLGVHRYEAWWEASARTGETGRGILYTCRAGFVDLSHVRETMDWVKFLHDRVSARLAGAEAGPAEFVWSGTRFRLEVTPPAWLGELSPGDREALSREVAIRFGQRAAVVMGAWHELATWWGQETVPGISEKRSAFTWDDSTSHAAAALAAGRALRSGERNWNLAATNGLREQLAEMGAVSTGCESEAVRLVEGSWWADGEPLKRDLDTGLTEGVKTPWLVPGLDCCGTPEPLQLPVVRWRDAGGVDWGSAIRFTIRPPRWLAERATGLADPPRELTEEGLDDCLVRLRAVVRQEQGPGALAP
jgi:hypothetical protein